MSGLGKKALGEGLLKEDLTYPECFIFFFFFYSKRRLKSHNAYVIKKSSNM